ncbi:MAG: B12-binding domain-containing radical SAM protein [Myxococcales bacterium]|nr:B12-binding domain-containing radical SAM protein [Myxococcales bacterium]
MKILLVMPTPYETGRLGLENSIWLAEPVALTAIAATVSNRHEVQVLDMRLEREEVLARTLADFRPDLVGTTSMTTDVYQAKAVLRMTRQIVPEALTVVGGHAATLQPQEFQEPYVDVIVQGEGEETFEALVEAWELQRAVSDRRFNGINGLRYVDGDRWLSMPKRAQAKNLDELPIPDRSLIDKYRDRYFFVSARGMASIFTSRGCSYDCNFCAIWEFYERRTRFLSAEKIVDQMEACEEEFIFILDDNFLTNKKRVLAFCEEIERRGVRKFWMTQGRTDFVADNPAIMKRLARAGLVGLLSGFESNDDDNLKALRKKNTWEKNKRANAIMRELGIFSTGIFMVRADWEQAQFDSLYDYINTLDIGIPLVTILTPLPGTQLYRAYRDKLMTLDYRLFDLLHCVLPTRLPREEFYRHFARSIDACDPSIRRAMKNLFVKRPDLARAMAPHMPWFYARTWRYQRVHRDHTSFLRDEEGLLNGPGATKNLSWEDVSYPGEDASQQARPGRTTLVQLKIPRRIWADDLPQPQSLPSAEIGRIERPAELNQEAS